MRQPVVLPGTLGDVEAAAAFWAGYSDSARTPAQLAQGYLTADGALFTIAGARHGIVGLAVGTQARLTGVSEAPVHGTFHINTVFTAPECRRAGIGRALLERLIADAHAAGYTRFQLWVHTANGAARTLYEKLGFRSDALPEDGQQEAGIIRYVHAAPGTSALA